MFLLTGISVVRELSSPFFPLSFSALQITAIKTRLVRAKHGAPLNVISPRAEEGNKRQ